MKKNLFVLVAILACLSVSAQDNGLNPVYKVQLGDITYQKGEASKKVTVGKVLGVIAESGYMPPLSLLHAVSFPVSPCLFPCSYVYPR